MKYKEILDFLGPCGLNCKKCVFTEEKIVRLAAGGTTEPELKSERNEN